MFKVGHIQFRRTALLCCAVLCIALMQIAVAPVTYELHICCHDETSSTDHGSEAQRACSCVHHTDQESKSGDSTSEQPHDSDSCRICQAAFAISLSSFASLELQELGTVSILRQADFLAPEFLAEYRSLSRGPPICGSPA